MLIQDLMIKYVRETFENRGWKYKYDEDMNDFSMHSRVNSFFSSITSTVRVTERNLLFFVTSDILVKKNLRAVTEYIARINHNLTFGAFELDCDTGEPRFYMSLSGNDLEAQNDDYIDFIAFHIAHSAILFEHVITGIYPVMFNEMSPKKSAEEVEEKNRHIGDDDDDDD
ncbi:MAG: YbjN domain-containing protein, partial [Victivallales bacterium]|nr:YbjN domain-containing protein [Victivallales bacterium]